MFPNVSPPQGAMLSERHLKNSPKYVQKKYPLFARIALKFAQLVSFWIFFIILIFLNLIEIPFHGEVPKA
jgi:hypothetical protein